MSMTKKERTDLEVAQIRVREIQARIDALFGEKTTNTYYCESGSFTDYPLTPNANIKFIIGKHEETIHARIDKDGSLLIMGSSAITIAPSAANCVEIRIGKA